jgi:hypothetical protein
MVAKSHAGLLEGVGYADPVLFDGHYRDLPAAIALAKRTFSDVRVAQVCDLVGKTKERHCTNFVHEAWSRLGRPWGYGVTPLLFDRINLQRESELLKFWLENAGEKKLILVASHGLSSPFQHEIGLCSLLESEFGETHNILPINHVQADRPQDILGLFKRADCLVTVDTMHLHLAAATPLLPVIALASDAHHGWGQSPPRPQHILHVPYSQFQDRRTEIVDAARGLPAKPRQVWHVTTEFLREPRAEWRHARAALTWPDSVRRLAVDSKTPPTVLQLVGLALERASDRDIILISNDDIAFAPGFEQRLLSVQNECGWCHRRDFGKVDHPLNANEILTGAHYCGIDTFWFSKRWWLKWAHDFPPMVVGRQGWDYVMIQLIKGSGGARLEGLTYHQMHQSYWSAHQRDDKWNISNIRLAQNYLASHGLDTHLLDKETLADPI